MSEKITRRRSPIPSISAPEKILRVTSIASRIGVCFVGRFSEKSFDSSVEVVPLAFSCSVVALDPNTGQRKWHYQFTPGDSHDWDANEDVVLADSLVAGVKRKLMLPADRNGMFYVLD